MAGDAFLDDGEDGVGPDRLLSASDSRIALWDLDQLSRIGGTYPFDTQDVCVACSAELIWPSPDGRYIVTDRGDLGGGPLVQALRGAPTLGRLGGSAGWITPMWRADSGATLVPDGSRSNVLIVDPAAGRVLRTIPAGLGTESWVVGFGMDPAGSAVTVIGNSGEVRVLDTRDGHLIRTGPSIPEMRSDDVRQFAISNRLDQVVVLGNMKSWFRDLSTGQVRELPGLDQVSFGGNLLSYRTLGGKLEIRDVRTWRLIRADPGLVFVGPALSPDGHQYALQRRDGTVEVRDVATGDLLLSFGLPSSREGSKTSLAFSLDGSHLFTVTEGAGYTEPGQAQEWTLGAQAHYANVCRAAGRDLTTAELTDLAGTIPDGLEKCPKGVGATTAAVQTPAGERDQPQLVTGPIHLGL